MTKQSKRSNASSEKRQLILAAAKEVFAEHGLEGASLRAVAGYAGYTPAALYFHFESKEALYAEVLHQSLERLAAFVETATTSITDDAERLSAAAMAFYVFYRENPRDLDLGFYLFRGGMKPAGLGHGRDSQLNGALEAALLPIAQAAKAMGADETAAKMLMVDCFAHATGLLLLLHTGRIRMFDACANERMDSFIQEKLQKLSGAISEKKS